MQGSNLGIYDIVSIFSLFLRRIVEDRTVCIEKKRLAFSLQSHDYLLFSVVHYGYSVTYKHCKSIRQGILSF